MAKTTVVRGEHEHSVQLQGNDPVAQSKRVRANAKDLSEESAGKARIKGAAEGDARVKVVLPKPRPTPKMAASKLSIKSTPAQVGPVTDLAAGEAVSPEEVWETESHIVQRLSALKLKNSQLTAQIQRLADTLPGKGSES